MIYDGSLSPKTKAGFKAMKPKKKTKTKKQKQILIVNRLYGVMELAFNGIYKLK